MDAAGGKVRDGVRSRHHVWPLYRNGASTAPSWLGRVRSWAVVDGPVDLDDLEGFELVVVCDPAWALQTWLRRTGVAQLHARGIRAVAHVPLVRPLPLPIALLESRAGNGLRDAHWYREAATRIRYLADVTWDGCYLDDVAEALAFDDGSGAVRELIAIARAASRGGIVITQAVQDQAVIDAADLVGASVPISSGARQRLKDGADS